MKTIIGSDIKIQYPSKEITQWARDNLTVSNPEFTTKLRMNLWLGNTPETLSLYERRGYTLVLPFGVINDILPMLHGSQVETDFVESEPIDYNAEVPLYDYQKKAVDKAMLNYYGIIQSPAGSGKTQMGIALVSKLRKRTLWLTHTKDLLNQSRKRAEQYIDKSLIGTITDGKVNLGAGITFATIQTMCKLDLYQYKHYFDVIIVDECHRVAGTPTTMTQFYKVLNNLSCRHKYGLSATVHRSDGMIKATYAVLGKIIHSVSDDEVGDKIMKVGVKTISTGIAMDLSCVNTDGTLNYAKMISSLCGNQKRNKIIRDCILENADCSCLILSDRLVHLDILYNSLPEQLQEKAVVIKGSSDKKLREKAIEDMRKGKKTIMFASYSLAKEGLDIPRLERLFMVSPQKDYAIVTQSIGRIARTFKGKKDPICYDFVDNSIYFKKSFLKRSTTYRKNKCYFIKD